MDPVSFMKREISQLVDSGVEYKDRLFVGNGACSQPRRFRRFGSRTL
eukprot:SAG11_NODE_2408_length_3396_cov_2.260843_2_plen_47_part_00